MKDGSVCLYDLPEKRVLQVCELPSRGDSPMPELEYVLHPDGSMVAFYDKQKRRTILLAADTLGVLADLDMVFVTMLEEGGCLLRGKVSKQKEALFLPSL